MSTLKTTYIQHPSAESPAIELDATDGVVFSAASFAADAITSGTLDSARLSGSYTSITGTGALDAGSVTSGFGNIDIGTSTFTGGGVSTQSVLLTASNASYSIPTAARKPGVRVAVIGGGGGGGGVNAGAGGTGGGTGGTSSFAVSGLSTISAAGGAGGTRVLREASENSVQPAPNVGFVSANHGNGGVWSVSDANAYTAGDGNGGAITVAYLDLTGKTTANATVGSGGAGGTSNRVNGRAGGRGAIILEY